MSKAVRSLIIFNLPASKYKVCMTSNWDNLHEKLEVVYAVLMISQRVSGKQHPHLNQSVSSTDMCVCYMCFFLIVSQHLCSKAQLYKPILPHKPVRRHCIDRFCVITEEQASSCLDALRLCVCTGCQIYTWTCNTDWEQRQKMWDGRHVFIKSRTQW